jgi:hypothetical protein
MKRNLAMWAILGVALLGLSPLQAAWNWTFESGPEGWNVVDLQTGGPYDPPLAQYSVSQSSVGGCAGGYIHRLDPSSNSFAFRLPVEQLPEGQSWDGGRLEFCLRSTHHNWTSEAFVIVVGGDGTILRAPIALPGIDWSSYGLDLLPATFITSSGSQPTESQFLAVMGHVDALYIMAEYGAAVQENSAVDEVRLRPACEPLDAPQVWAEVTGTPEAPALRLAWLEVPGAWTYEILSVAGPWGAGVHLGETQGTTWELPVGTEDVGVFRVRARCD